MTSYLFLAIALTGAWLTVNAHLPIRGSATLMFPSFIAGWLASELVVQHLCLQLAVTAVLVLAGALDALPGRIALGLTVLSWIGMLRLARMSRNAVSALEPALRDGLARHGLVPLEVPAASSRPLAPFSRSDPEVSAHLDLRYADGAGDRHLLDVYTSRLVPQGAPVLLQIHGGGWFTGHKRQQAMPLMLHMAKLGWVCVSANYRLSPRATFPEHIEDVKLALAWIRRNIARHGGDPQYVAITGGSAGGHLAALAALTANAPEYQRGFESVDTTLRACVPFYGVYDFSDRLGHQRHDGLARLVSRWVLKKRIDLEPEAFDRASPMSHIHASAPPFFVVHGTHDNIASVADARAFVAKLRGESMQPVSYAELPGAHHAFEIFYSARTARTVEAVARFLCTIHARDQRPARSPQPSAPERAVDAAAGASPR